MKAEFRIEGGSKKLELLVTAGPMPGDEPFALLVLEDIS